MGLRDLAGRLRRSEDGVAAVELSMVAGLFCFGVLNVAELSRYAFSSMEHANATQMGIAAALAACDVAHLPATQNCSGLTSAVTTALQGTSLGTQVTLQGSISEGYYCVNGSHVLTFVSSATSPPSDCSSVTNATGKPALYLKLSSSYTYNPMFGDATVVGALPHQLTRTAWTRMQ